MHTSCLRPLPNVIGQGHAGTHAEVLRLRSRTRSAQDDRRGENRWDQKFSYPRCETHDRAIARRAGHGCCSEERHVLLRICAATQTPSPARGHPLSPAPTRQRALRRCDGPEPRADRAAASVGSPLRASLGCGLGQRGLECHLVVRLSHAKLSLLCHPERSELASAVEGPSGRRQPNVQYKFGVPLAIGGASGGGRSFDCARKLAALRMTEQKQPSHSLSSRAVL